MPDTLAQIAAALETQQQLFSTWALGVAALLREKDADIAARQAAEDALGTQLQAMSDANAALLVQLGILEGGGATTP